MKAKTLRFRMMVLFTTVVGVLLAGSYLAFWGLLSHEIPTQLNRQLLETARPLVADISSEPDARDVNRLDIPGEFFEVRDPSGVVLQHSKNLTTPIDLTGISLPVSRPAFGIAAIGKVQSVRVALVPFQQGSRLRILVVAIPTLGTNRVLDSFGRVALLLFPLIGWALHLTEPQFGLWAALAIHDTSSVVGATSKYGASALVVGTTVKLARALWIVPLALVTAAVKRSASRVKLPWFILFFCLAAVVNTYVPTASHFTTLLFTLGRYGLTATLFLIGTSISRTALREVGWRPLAQGMLLWMAVALTSLYFIRAGFISL